MIAENIQSIRTRIGAACRSAGREGEIVFRSEKVDEKIGDAVYALFAN